MYLDFCMFIIMQSCLNETILNVNTTNLDKNLNLFIFNANNSKY